MATEQLREATCPGGATRAGKGAEGNVLLVGRPPRRALQLLAGQPDQAAAVALPQVPGRVRVAGTSG
jgi:hypothetical protein